MNYWEKSDFLIQTPKRIRYDIGNKTDIFNVVLYQYHLSEEQMQVSLYTCCCIKTCSGIYSDTLKAVDHRGWNTNSSLQVTLVL